MSARSPSLFLVSLLAGLGAPGVALATGSSADTELIKPSWSEGAMPGIESARLSEPGTVRTGVFLQYTKDPLILYAEGSELGTVIANRATLTGGVAWDVAKRFGIRASLPLGAQWGTEIPEYTLSGPLRGDLFIGGRLGLVDQKAFALTLRGDVGIPTGTRTAWFGEARFRGVFGPTMMVQVRDFDILADVNVTARQPIPTGLDLTLGSELVASVGARYNVVPGRAAVGLGYLQRNGLDYFLQAGAENPSELISSVMYRPVTSIQLDGGVGKGLAEGYGTSAFRAFVGITWIKPPKGDDPPPSLDLVRVPPPPEQVEVEPVIPEEPVWEEEELARIEGERIVIRDPIEFEFATSNILPASLPTLQYVADLLNENWQIAHLVIEGHASEEGSFVYNYDLSIRRSRAIWEALIRAGVHPDRMSYRGMGEVVPRNEGEDEASLAGNRRVEFEIVRQYRPDETPEPMRENVRLPWTGEPANVGTPPKPEAPPPPPKNPEDLDLDDFFEEEDAEAAPDSPAPKAPPEDTTQPPAEEPASQPADTPAEETP
mgnify:CR=1 FL=1